MLLIAVRKRVGAEISGDLAELFRAASPSEEPRLFSNFPRPPRGEGQGEGRTRARLSGSLRGRNHDGTGRFFSSQGFQRFEQFERIERLEPARDYVRLDVTPRYSLARRTTK
jgi:hypothetical protein